MSNLNTIDIFREIIRQGKRFSREEIFAEFNFAVQRERFPDFAVNEISKVSRNLISRLSNILQIFLCKKSNFSIAVSDILKYNHEREKKDFLLRKLLPLR